MTLKRTRPRVGDHVVSNASGRWYQVTDVLVDYRGHWEMVEVKSLDDDRPNVFNKGEFTIHHHPR